MAKKSCDAGTQTLPPRGTPDRREATTKAVEELRRRANKGDLDARKRLVRFLKSNPDLMRRFGDLADLAETKAIEVATGGEWLTTQCTRHEINELRKKLLGPSPTALEEIAVQRIVTAWVGLQAVQIPSGEPHRDLAWAKFWMARLEGAGKTFDSAVRSLLLIRELQPGLAAPDAKGKTTRRGGGNGTSRAKRVNGAKNGHGLNGLKGDAVASQVSGVKVPGRVNGSSRLNGHGNRLANLLVPAGAGRDG